MHLKLTNENWCHANNKIWSTNFGMQWGCMHPLNLIIFSRERGRGWILYAISEVLLYMPSCDHMRHMNELDSDFLAQGRVAELAYWLAVLYCKLLYPQEDCKAVLYSITLLLRLQQVVTSLPNWQHAFFVACRSSVGRFHARQRCSSTLIRESSWTTRTD